MLPCSTIRSNYFCVFQVLYTGPQRRSLFTLAQPESKNQNTLPFLPCSILRIEHLFWFRFSKSPIQWAKDSVLSILGDSYIDLCIKATLSGFFLKAHTTLGYKNSTICLVVRSVLEGYWFAHTWYEQCYQSPKQKISFRATKMFPLGKEFSTLNFFKSIFTVLEYHIW